MARTSSKPKVTQVRVWDRNGIEAGVVKGMKPCPLDGCGGYRLNVVWPDGQRTWPCMKGLEHLPNGDYKLRSL